MPGRRFRMYSREFKEAAVHRVLGGEKIPAVARALRLGKLLYTWLDQYEQGGAAALVPRGRPIPEVPVLPAVPRDPMPALVATNRAHGLAIDPSTAGPNWLGERLDLGWAIDVLHPACNPAAPRPERRCDSPADRMFMSTPWWTAASPRDDD